MSADLSFSKKKMVVKNSRLDDQTLLHYRRTNDIGKYLQKHFLTSILARHGWRWSCNKSQGLTNFISELRFLIQVTTFSFGVWLPLYVKWNISKEHFLHNERTWWVFSSNFFDGLSASWEAILIVGKDGNIIMKLFCSSVCLIAFVHTHRQGSIEGNKSVP